MRQGVKDSYDWEAAVEKVDIDHHNSRPTMESRVSKRNESSSSDDRSTPSPSLDDERHDQNPRMMEKSQNYLSFRLDRSFAKRKASMCSNGSSINSTPQSLDGAGSESGRHSPFYNSDFDATPVKYDDIIDKIVELKFSQNSFTEGSSTSLNRNGDKIAKETSLSKSCDLDDVNGNYESTKENGQSFVNGVPYEDDEEDEDENYNSCEAEESDDDDLVERGPVRPHLNGQYHNEKPYTLDWIASAGQNVHQNQSDISDYDTFIKEISRNEQLCEKLNSCLDKLSNETQCNRNSYNIGEQLSYPDPNATNGWSKPEFNYTSTPNVNIIGDYTSKSRIPPIVLSDDAELLEKLTSGVFQAAQTLPDPMNIQNPSPSGVSNSEPWPDSPASSRQRDEHALSPRSHSRASSRAHSPGSSANIGSPPFHHNILGSPSDRQQNMGNFRGCNALSSSESSNHSFADTPSPLSYQYGIDQKIEDELGLNFEGFSTCYPNYMSSETVINSADTIDAIVNDELERVEEAERCQNGFKPTDGVQVVPETRYETKVSHPACQNDLVSREVKISTNLFDDPIRPEGLQSKIIAKGLDTDNCGEQNFQQLYPLSEMTLENSSMLMNNTQNHLVRPDFYNPNDLAYNSVGQSNIYNMAQSLMDFENPMGNLTTSGYAGCPTGNGRRTESNESTSKVSGRSQVGRAKENHSYFDNATKPNSEATSNSAFNEFQIPETVSSFRQSRLRRSSERNIAPWPSLNLPDVAASEILKADLDPREVEKAMKNLLKRKPEELAAGDVDGDTMLMCLVGSPVELEKKKAYLVPLVERLDGVTGALTRMNNRNEDALYIAAIHCPQAAYVTGYLGAAMLQRNVDIGQRLYHGDTLVHAVAAKGDTHLAVLAELLALRTIHGNSVFDLSQRNYNGRTSLHVAVESHDPSGSGIKSIKVTKLLLEKGADPKIQEIKYKNTALHMAVSLARDPDLIRVLLSKNGHELVNITNCMNNTALHIACALSRIIPIERQIQICTDLIRAGGQMNIHNGQGKVPFALASPERREAIRQIGNERRISSDLVYQ